MANSNPQLERINHVVVLVMENRSFDNVLGWLYEHETVPRGQTFEGVSGKDLSNPAPGGGTVPVGKGNVMTDPFPDPNEPYDQVYAQYAQEARQSTSRQSLPPNVQNLVDRYFGSIAPASDAPQP